MLPPPQTTTLFPYTTLFRSLGSLTTVTNNGDGTYTATLTSTTTGTANLRSEEHTSELQSQFHLVCRLLLEKKKDLAPRFLLPDGAMLSFAQQRLLLDALAQV